MVYANTYANECRNKHSSETNLALEGGEEGVRSGVFLSLFMPRNAIITGASACSSPADPAF